MDETKKVRTRIAPSPTGFPHIGTIYQVIFDYCLARKYNGSFVLRIEDTDRARFVEGAEEVIYESLKWFNLIPDESPIHEGEYGPYRQSERLDIYKKYADQLIENGHAYYCFCTKERLEEMRKAQEAKKQTPMYDRHCRNLSPEEVEKHLKEGLPHVIRMKIPDNRKIVINDLIMGTIEFDSSTIDDQVILKSDGFPTYHLAVVVDDYLMKISHVIRGREWMTSTPKHILLYEYFGWEKEMPFFAHLPLLLNSDGKGKLSKRHGHSSVDFYREGGYLPKAIINYLINIVWNHPEGKEIFPLEEFQKEFHIGKIGDNLSLVSSNGTELVTSQGARFDLQKLTWVNQQWIQKLSDDELINELLAFYPGLTDHEELVRKLLPLVRTRMETLKDFGVLAGHFLTEISINPRNEDEKALQRELFEKMSQLADWNKDSIFAIFKNIMTEKKVRMPVFYYLLTGAERGLPLPESIEILGKEKTLERLKS